MNQEGSRLTEIHLENCWPIKLSVVCEKMEISSNVMSVKDICQLPDTYRRNEAEKMHHHNTMEIRQVHEICTDMQTKHTNAAIAKHSSCYNYHRH